MDKIREEFEKQGIIWDVLGEGARLLALDQFTNGWASRDAEIKKLKSIADDYENTYTQIELKNKKMRETLKHIAERSYSEAPYISSMDAIWILATEALKEKS